MKYKVTYLREVVSFISKGIAPKYVEKDSIDSVRVVNQRCNRNNRISLQNSRLNNLKMRNVPKIKYLHKGDILINSTGVGTAGRVAQIKENFDKPVTFDGHMILIRGNSQIDSLFLGYYLEKNQRVIEQFAEGSTGQTEINRERLLDELVIKFPTSVDEQRRLAERFRLLDRKIDLNNQINDNLLKLAREQYKKIIASSVLVETKLKDFAIIIMGQSPNSKTYNEKGIGIPLLNGAADFRDGIHPKKWTTDPKRIVNKGAYIFGVRATVGLTTKVYDNYAIGRGTGSAVAKDVTNDEFLYFVLEDMFKYFANTASGSVYINISKNDFEEYTFYKPQDKELGLFHKIINPIMKKIYTNKEENLILTQIKKSLLNYFL